MYVTSVINALHDLLSPCLLSDICERFTYTSTKTMIDRPKSGIRQRLNFRT